MQENPKEKLWKSLNDSQYYTKSYKEFEQQFNNPKSVKALYDNLNKAEYYTKSEKDFSSQFFAQSKVQTPTKQPTNNPFSGQQVVPTINVATNKVGSEKITVGNNKPVKEKPSKWADLGNSVASTLNDTYSSLAKIPRYLYEAASIPQNLLADAIDNNAGEGVGDFLRLNNKAYDDLINSTPLVSPLSYLDKAGDFYGQQKTTFQERVTKYDKDITNSLLDGNWGDAGSQLVNNISGSLPSMLLMAGTSGIGATAKLGGVSKTLLSALPFASSKANEIRDNKDISDSLKPIISLGYGLTEVVYDQKFGTQAIINKITDKFKKEGLEQAVDASKKVATGYMMKAFNGVKEPVTDLVKNAMEEGLTQWSQNLIDKITVNPDKDLMEGVPDAMLVGASMGGGISALGAVVNRKTNTSIKDKTKNIDELTLDLEKEIPQEAKEQIQSKISQLKKEVITEIDKSQTDFNALDEDSKEKAVELTDKIQKIELTLTDESISEITKETLKDEKVKLETKLEEIKHVQEVVATNEVITPITSESTTEDVKPLENVKEEVVVVTPKVETTQEVKPTEPIAVKEDDTVTIPPRIEGGSERTMVFKDGEWKQSVGGSLTEVGKGLQEQSQKAFEVANAPLINEVNNIEAPVTEAINPTEKVTKDIKIQEFNTKADKIAEDIISFLTPKGAEGATKNGMGAREVVEAAVSIIKVANEAKENVSEAVNKAIQYIKDNYEGTLDEGGLRKYFNNLSKEPAVEEPKVSGIKKALVPQEVVDKVVFENSDVEKLTDKEFQELGKQLVESGEIDVEGIVRDISGGNRKALQPKEVVALIYYKAKLDNEYTAALKEKSRLILNKESTKDIDAKINFLEQDIQNFNVTAVVTASEQSLAFRLRKGLLDTYYNVVQQIARYKATNGGVIDPEIEAKFQQYDKDLNRLKAEIKDAETRAEEAEAKIAVSNIQSEIAREQTDKKETVRRKKVESNLKVAKDEFNAFLKSNNGRMNSFSGALAQSGVFGVKLTKLVKAHIEVGIVDLADLIKKLKEDYGKDFTDTHKDLIEEVHTLANQNPNLPTVNTDGSIKVPSKFIKDLVATGVTDINELSQQVLDKIKDVLPDATLRQVRDAITGYGKEVGQTQDAIQQQVNEAKRLGRLYTKLEDLQNSIKQQKVQKVKNTLSEEEVKLKKQIKVLEDALPKTDYENTKTLEAKKRYYKKVIAEKTERLANKNFAPRAKSNSILIPDTELKNLELEAQKIINAYDEAHYENEQNNKSKTDKFTDALTEWSFALARGLQAGLDLSAFGVQLAIYVPIQLVTNPKQLAQTVEQSFRFLASEKYQNDFLNKIKTHPYYEVMRKSGLALQFQNSKLGSRDYQLQGSAINKLFNFTIIPIKWQFGEKAYEKAKLLNPYRATERAFTGAIDVARMQMFLDYVKDLEMNGYTFEGNPDAYKLAAKVVNTMTFNGDLGMAAPMSPILSLALFAPKKIAASLAMFNPQFYLQLGKEGRKVIIKKNILGMAKFLTMAVTTTLLSNMYYDDDNEDILNPYSSDFMKIRIGNTRLDMFAGLGQYVVFFSRFFLKNYKKTGESKTKELGIPNQTPTRKELLYKFGENKLAPIPSYAFKWMGEQVGRENDWDDEAINSVTPLWFNGIDELYKEQPREMATAIAIMSFIGQSSNTFGNADFLDIEKDADLRKMLVKKGGQYQKKTRASIKAVNQDTGEEEKIDKGQYEVYNKVEGEFIKRELRTNYEKLNNMTPSDFEAKFKKIKKDAKEEAYFAATNTLKDLDIIEDRVSNEDGAKSIKYELTPEQIKIKLKLVDEYMTKRGNNTVKKFTVKYAKDKTLSKEQVELKAKAEVMDFAYDDVKYKLLKMNKKGEIKLEEKQ